MHGMFIESNRSKTRRLIAPEDVPQRFDDCCIDKLATLAKLPKDADLLTFRTEVQRAATIYLRDAGESSGNDRRKEVAALYRAASRRNYAALKACIEQLSEQTRHDLNSRGSLFRPRAMLPDPQSIDDPERRDAACRTALDLSQHGGRWVEGRKRPSGRRSRTWEPLLYAPEARSRPQRRESERTFVMWLQLAYLDAVGTAPALTASAERRGPFVRLVQQCLRLVGAPEADAVGLINDLHATRTTRRDRHLSGTKA